MIEINAVRTVGTPLSEGLEVARIGLSLGDLPLAEMNRLGRAAARRISSDLGGMAVFWREGGQANVYYIGPGRPENGTVEVVSRGVATRIQMQSRGSVVIAPSQTWVMEAFVRESLHRRIKSLGYKRSRFNKFYGGSPKFFVVGEFQEPVYVYDGFEIRPRVYTDGSVLVYLNPSATWRINLHEFVRLLRARGVSDAEIEDYIIGGRPRRQVKVEPYGKSCLLINIEFDASVDDFRLGDETLRSRWSRKYGVRMPEDDFVVNVDDERTPLAYPASQVYLSTRGLPFSDQQRKVFILPPKKKSQRTLDSLSRLLSKPVELGNVRVVFNVQSLTTLETLERGGEINGSSQLKPPLLKFAEGGVSEDPRDIRLHGPYSGAKNITVLYVVPEAFEHLVDPFADALSDSYGNLGLGSLELARTHVIRGKPSGIAYRQVASAVASDLSTLDGPKIAIVVLPFRGGQKYEFVKGASSFEEGERYFQFVLRETVERAINGDRFLTNNIVTQLYFKALDPTRNEALWILSKPAGGVGNTVYVAYDVSREVNREYDPKTKRVLVERTEAAARAAICDCFGLSVRMKSKVSPVGEALTRETIKDIIIGLEKEARESLRHFGHDLKRIVMFKDGEIRINERRIIEQAVEEIREVLPELRFEAYSVVKGGIERVYGPGSTNPPAGFLVKLTESEALLISSDLSRQRDKVTGEERLLADPLLIRREIEVPGDGSNFDALLQEFFDLSRLHWQSLYAHTKTCLPLKLVQEIGEYSRREIVFPQDIAYPPL